MSCLYICPIISIHAPARGATGSASTNVQVHMISIHAPARGATVNLFGLTYYFDISIHAPARGATRLTIQNRKEMVFQSTLPRGERLGAIFSKCSRINYFNPRSREGSDVKFQTYQHGCYNFNPRSREGSDAFRSRIVNRLCSFQSTLPRGERQW